MANFGVGVGDIIAVSALAFKAYRACSHAVDTFRDIDVELENFQNVIGVVEREFPTDAVIQSRADRTQRGELKALLERCRRTLKGLEQKANSHRKLKWGRGTIWDKVKFATFDVVGTRNSLAAHTNALNLFLSTLSVSRLRRIEDRLQDVIEEVQQGSRDFSAVTQFASNTERVRAETQWLHLEEELVRDGFVREDIATHRQWFETRIRETIQRREWTGHQARGSDTPSPDPEHGLFAIVKACTALNDPSLFLEQGDQLQTLTRIDFKNFPGTVTINFKHLKTSRTVILRRDQVRKISQDTPPGTPVTNKAHQGKLDKGFFRRQFTSREQEPETPLERSARPTSRSTGSVRVARSNSRIRDTGPARPSSVASVRSEILEYDRNGRLVKSKTITTTFGEGPSTPEFPRRTSAPPLLQHPRSKSATRFKDEEDDSDQARSPTSPVSRGMSEVNLSQRTGQASRQTPSHRRPSPGNRRFPPTSLQAPTNIKASPDPPATTAHQVDLRPRKASENNDPPRRKSLDVIINHLGSYETMVELYAQRTRQLRLAITLLTTHRLIDGDPLDYSPAAIRHVECELNVLDEQLAMAIGQLTMTNCSCGGLGGSSSTTTTTNKNNNISSPTSVETTDVLKLEQDGG